MHGQQRPLWACCGRDLNSLLNSNPFGYAMSKYYSMHGLWEESTAEPTALCTCLWEDVAYSSVCRGSWLQRYSSRWLPGGINLHLVKLTDGTLPSLYNCELDVAWCEPVCSVSAIECALSGVCLCIGALCTCARVFEWVWARAPTRVCITLQPGLSSSESRLCAAYIKSVWKPSLRSPRIW